MQTTNAAEEKRQALKYVRRWGGATSDALLDPACQLFSVPYIEGMIGYRPHNHTLVAYGDPITAPSDRAALATAFQQYCLDQKKGFIYTIASEEFAKISLQNGCGGYIEFGQELILEPHVDPTESSNGRLLRKKVRHAESTGVEIHEYLGYDEQLEERLNEIADLWLKKRHGLQIYISQIRLFEERYGKRWFYARRGANIVGVVALTELEASHGWLIDRLMTPPNENGVSELLVISILKILAQEGSDLLSIGAMPAAKLGDIQGFGCLSQWMSRTMYKGAQKIFHLDSKRKYWDKFHPQARARYLIFDKSTLNVRKLWCLARALNVSL